MICCSESSFLTPGTPAVLVGRSISEAVEPTCNKAVGERVACECVVDTCSSEIDPEDAATLVPLQVIRGDRASSCVQPKDSVPFYFDLGLGRGASTPWWRRGLERNNLGKDCRGRAQRTDFSLPNGVCGCYPCGNL